MNSWHNASRISDIVGRAFPSHPARPSLRPGLTPWGAAACGGGGRKSRGVRKPGLGTLQSHRIGALVDLPTSMLALSKARDCEAHAPLSFVHARVLFGRECSRTS